MANASRVKKELDESEPRKGILQLLLKAFTQTDDEWPQEDLLDVIHWQRQLIAITCGLIWGILPLTGLYPFLGYIALNQALVLSWWRMQRIEEDDYGGTQALMGEGLPPSIGLFVFVWILAFTAIGSR